MILRASSFVLRGAGATEGGGFEFNQFLGKLSATVRIKHSVHDLTSTISVDTD
eukprot:COSAG06_NODE_10632_length_1645_cov_1.322122_2_plen_52_part_01